MPLSLDVVPPLSADNRNALVLEGGGMRGVFTAGVCDVLLERGFADAFYAIWGVSAGATNASCFKARQPGRSIRGYLAYRDDPRFMSVASYLRTGNVAGAEFIYTTIAEQIDPLDYETFNANPLRMVAVASDVTFGTPAYLEVRDLPRDKDRVRASASLPTLSEIVEIDGYRYLDGGTTDSVPVEVALGEREGTGVPADLPAAERAVVVLTQHREYVKGSRYKLMPAAKRRYAGYPAFLEAIASRGERYNAQRQHIWELEAEGKALVIAPPEPVDLSVTESSGDKLLRLYVQGRQQALAALPQLHEFLGV